ncbi:hypothetical protein [Streptomyces melanogenes]|uniref:hypothetical protein n=1 Tax=Streptomyces melanogenes TaxID=67326 RepID=UPI001987ACA5|nr:hypothetical protein [Streptomyces melanogenes]GGP84490.1 hypothetical protein GCM10010278_73720 [Streptomyces melanogenes]
MSEPGGFPPAPADEQPLSPEPGDSTETEAERLRAELAEAREEEARYRGQAEAAAERETELQRERLGRKYSLPDVFAALIQGDDDDAREAHAKALAEAFHARPVRLGNGGLDPTGGDRQAVTWDRLFARARQNRAHGQGATIVGGLR